MKIGQSFIEMSAETVFELAQNKIKEINQRHDARIKQAGQDAVARAAEPRSWSHKLLSEKPTGEISEFTKSSIEMSRETKLKPIQMFLLLAKESTDTVHMTAADLSLLKNGEVDWI